jgi:hypothetical protein
MVPVHSDTIKLKFRQNAFFLLNVKLNITLPHPNGNKVQFLVANTIRPIG